MLGAIQHARRRSGLRLLALVTFAGFSACSTDDSGPSAPVNVSGVPTPRFKTAIALVTATYTGIPYGPFGLWKLSALKADPAPFTVSHNFINADSLVAQINAARNAGQRLVLAMTGGGSEQYITNGQFDMDKWKSVMNTYRKKDLKQVVADAVADGTIVGNTLIDEPETKQWGTNLTKSMVDQMATYAKNIFPTLPVGVNHGPPGYTWRSTERYKKVDYAVYQYAHWVTAGDVAAWKAAVLAQARRDGVKTGMSLNILNGGAQDRDGTYDCSGGDQGGLGTKSPNCRMTPDQLQSWGEALTPDACVMLMWQYDASYMSDAANLDAINYVAALAASKPRPSCKRQ